MRQLNSRNMDRASIHDGHLSISTLSCGCCSDYYTNDPEVNSGDWEIPVDELIQYIEREEQRLERLKDYIADNNNLITITHINKD